MVHRLNPGARPLVLVVENQLLLLRSIAFLLTISGCEVRTASDGAEADRLLGRLNPDLILADCALPEMSGQALLSRVRSDQRLSAVPFILMSDRYELDDLLAALDQGATDILPRPFTGLDLIVTVQERLGDRLVQPLAS